jgi:hypothetical protein
MQAAAGGAVQSNVDDLEMDSVNGSPPTDFKG